MAETFVDVRLSAEEAELIDFALDLVTDAYADQAMVEQLQREIPHRSGLCFGESAAPPLLHPHRAALILKIATRVSLTAAHRCFCPRSPGISGCC